MTPFCNREIPQFSCWVWDAVFQRLNLEIRPRISARERRPTPLAGGQSVEEACKKLDVVLLAARR